MGLFSNVATDERVLGRLRSEREHLSGYPTSNLSELLVFLATTFRPGHLEVR